MLSKPPSSTYIQSAILAPLCCKFAGRQEIIKTGLHGCAYPLPSHKLVKASVATLKHIPTALSQFTHTHTHTARTPLINGICNNICGVFFVQNHPFFDGNVDGKCCIQTYLGDQPRHLTRYSILPCDSGEGGGKKMVRLNSSANIATSGALFVLASMQNITRIPCGCASFRCPPPQRRALRRRGDPFSPESDRSGRMGGGKR